LPRGESEADDDFAQRVRRWQGRILGSLDRDRLVLPQVGSLYEELAAADQLRMAFHSRPIGPYHLRSSVSSRVQDEASQPGEATRLELDALEERLKPFLAEGDAFDLELVERDWTTVEVCELAVLREQESRPQFARELWGKLVEAAANVVHQADWAPECERWRDLRRILLLAASDPVPSQDSAEENASEDWPDPSPRGDAANSLSCLVYRLGVADEEVTNALRALRSDGNRAVRFNFARGIPWLHRDASALFWELTDATIDEEPSIAVLDGMVLSLEQILSIDPDNAMPRLVRIREITEELASPTNAIFQKLTAAFLFHYLRTGAKNAWSQVQQLVEHCDEERAAHALGRLPGQCRMGGWLIGDQPDDPKPRRTWRFFELLLQSAQARRNDLHRTEESNPAFRRLSQLADSIAGQLYFGSGAHASTSKTSDGTTLTHRQLSQFWNDAKPVLELLSREAHPHTAARTVDTLCHLMPCDPEAAFQLALRCVTRSCESGNLHHDRLARDGVLRMIRTALSDHSQIFHRGDGHASACFNPLLDVIDRFLEADCSKTRSLVAELDSLYR
jgi:hypothetical protein